MADSPIREYFGDVYQQRRKVDGVLRPFTLSYAPIPYVDSPSFLQLKSWDPTEAQVSTWTVVSSLPKAFHDSHPPIQNLRLETHEEFLAYRAKIRPCLPLICTSRGDTEEVARQRFWTPTALVLPIYSFIGSDGRLKEFFTESFVRKVAALKYPQFFFIPRGAGLEYDGFARLDRVLSVPHKHIRPAQHELKEEVSQFLMACFRSFANGGRFFEGDGEFAEIAALFQESME